MKPNSQAKEIRHFVLPLTIAQRAEDSNTGTLTGYAARFDAWSHDLGWFREKIERGAFKRTLEDKGNDIRALADHRTDALAVVGRRSAGTLRLQEDNEGLKVEIDLPDTSAGRDLRTNIEAGNVDGMSFGFVVREDSWKRGEDGQPDERTLHDVDLIEVSVVAFPAYPDTSIAARSKEAALGEPPAPLSDETPAARARLRARRSAFKAKTTVNQG